jgi:hypothetical protein
VVGGESGFAEQTVNALLLVQDMQPDSRECHVPHQSSSSEALVMSSM